MTVCLPRTFRFFETWRIQLPVSHISDQQHVCSHIPSVEVSTMDSTPMHFLLGCFFAVRTSVIWMNLGIRGTLVLFRCVDPWMRSYTFQFLPTGIVGAHVHTICPLTHWPSIYES